MKPYNKKKKMKKILQIKRFCENIATSLGPHDLNGGERRACHPESIFRNVAGVTSALMGKAVNSKRICERRADRPLVA
jgi:hypothetical protein